MTIESLIEEAEEEFSYWVAVVNSYEKREKLGITFDMAAMSMSYYNGVVDALKEYKNDQS
jgi:hypothetical protein